MRLKPLGTGRRARWGRVLPLFFKSPAKAAVFFAIVVIVCGFIAVIGTAGGKLPLLSSTVEQPAVSVEPSEPPSEPAPAAVAIDIDEPEPTEQPWKVVRMRVTAYCPCAKCCGKYADGYTACMHKISEGDVFAAADKKYSFGTEIIVPGYNDDEPVRILDRGGAIKGDNLDVFFNSHRQAKQWGVKYLDVLIKD